MSISDQLSTPESPYSFDFQSHPAIHLLCLPRARLASISQALEGRMILARGKIGLPGAAQSPPGVQPAVRLNSPPPFAEEGKGEEVFLGVRPQ